MSFSGDCDAQGYVNVGFGESKTCTITNTRKTGKLFIDKVLFNNEGPGQPSDWTFTIGGVLGTWTNGQSLELTTGTYTITESTNIEGYSVMSVAGACSNLNGSSATLTIGVEDQHCIFTNARDKGSAQVHKRIDLNGDGDWIDTNENSDTYANNNGFSWELDGALRAYGTTVTDLATTMSNYYHTFSEYMPSGYRFVSWYNTNEAGRSCSNPNGTTLPSRLTITKNTTTEITLCNARDMGTVTIIKDAINPSDQNFRFDTNLPGGYFELEDDGYDHNGGTEESKTWNVPVGAYYVSERLQSGWKLGDISCETTGEWGVRDDNHSIAFTVRSGQNITCTFHNTELGKIKGFKFHDRNADGSWDWFEPGIANWSIYLEQNGLPGYQAGEPITQTSSNHWSYGWYEFDNLMPGDYQVCELMQKGWYNSTPVCQTTHLTPGDTDMVVFGNYQNGSITITKDVVTYNGNPVNDESGTEFTFHISSLLDTPVLSDGESQTIEGVMPGSYIISEDSNPAYDFGGCYVSSHERSRFTLNSGEQLSLICRNKQRTGDLEVTKFNDVNGNGTQDKDESVLSGWEINLEGQSSLTTNESGKVTFSQLLSGWYDLGETSQEDWTQINIDCDDEVVEEKVRESQNFSVYINPGTTTHCSIANQAKPVLTIEKTNDATGNKNPNDIVTYTLKLKLTGSDLENVQVTDVTPEGFTYIAGSWTSSLASVLEPSYASPGVWSLGSLKAGDVVTLTYQAKIKDGLDGGTYADIAWASGDSQGWSNILALGVDSSYIDQNFVGTSVTVNQDLTQSGNAKLEREIGGSVLGASTELPATGPDTAYLLLALLSLLAGLALLTGNKKMKKIIAILVTVSLYNLLTTPALAADPENNLSIRLEAPLTPTRDNEWKLSFSVLDRALRSPSVTCYVKKPSSGSYVSFGSAYSSTKVHGDNGSCQVNGDVMSEQGEYQFYALATAGSDSEESNYVTVKYDTSGPGTPNYYSKEHPSSCKYIIKFHTADDTGATTKVEIYSSDQKSFDTNSSTRVGTVNLGSNQDGSFTHDRADNCDKEWYYGVRAFDAAGNQSDFRGDEFVTVGTTTVLSSPVPGALVVTSANLGSVLGKKDEDSATTTSGEVLGEANPEVVNATDSTSAPVEAIKNMAKNRWFWLTLGAVVIITIIYVQIRRARKY